MVQIFLEKIQEWHGISQAELSRRAAVSQSWVNKAMVGNLGDRMPEPETLQKLVTTFSAEWERFLREQPDFVKQLRLMYNWLSPVFAASDEVIDPGLAEILSYVRQIYEHGDESHRQMVTRQLAAQAEFIRQPDSGRRRRHDRPYLSAHAGAGTAQLSREIPPAAPPGVGERRVAREPRGRRGARRAG